MSLNIATLESKVKEAWQILENCDLCPRRCHVNRLEDQKGYCKVGKDAMISSFGPHYGEEPPLVGRGGSGTIFFTGCNLGCSFCQNYDISHLMQGHPISTGQMSLIMLALQEKGCHNINLVTPSHVVPQILSAIMEARKEGLKVPIVYNCGGYEAMNTLKLLEGFIDIYMPDIKYFDSEVARELSDAPDYPEVVREAVEEMHRQVGDLQIEASGIASKGLLVRHLVLPCNLSSTREVMHFLATEISQNTYVNIMDQYRPCYKAVGHQKIGRRITRDEYYEALKIAHEEGLYRGF